MTSSRASVLAAAAGVGIFNSGWPDLLTAAALLVIFLRSAMRVLRAGWQSYYTEG